MHLGFQPEREFIETQLQHSLQPPDAFRTVPRQAKVKILGGASGACEAEFHGNSAFEIVGVDHASLHRMLQHSAEREKGYPSSQTFLVERLLACDARKSLFQTF